MGLLTIWSLKSRGKFGRASSLFLLIKMKLLAALTVAKTNNKQKNPTWNVLESPSGTSVRGIMSPAKSDLSICVSSPKESFDCSKSGLGLVGRMNSGTADTTGSALADFRARLGRVEGPEVGGVARGPNGRRVPERKQRRGPGRGGWACLGPGGTPTEAGPASNHSATWAGPDQLGPGDN